MHALPLLVLGALGASPQFEGELLDFSATWCGPCQRMNPIVHRLEREGLPVRQVDVDRNKSLAQRYGVTNIPAFVLVVNGKAVDRVVGVTTESRLRSMIARIPRATPPAVASNDRSRRSTPARRSTAGTPVTNVSGSGTFGAPSPLGGRPSPQVDLGLPSSFPGATVRANIDQNEDFDAPSFDAAAVGPESVGREVELEPSPEAAAPPASRPAPRDATVRIRVTDAEGVNFGSGTIVESKRGRALILSCGHVFRDLKQGSTIEVDIFDWANGRVARRETYVGDVLGYDLDSDVGLLAIPAQRRLPCCPVAADDERPSVGDGVVNIGCSRGELPTIENVKVKQLNRYLGPDNLQCTGVPVQGRSGGGLFDAEGRIVGVCIARDPRDQEGIYAGLEAIYALLDQRDLAHLHRSAEPPARVFANTTREESPMRLAVEEHRTPSREAQPTAGAERVFADSAASTAPDELAAAVPELANEVHDAEVICIIRKHGDPESESRVVVINRASNRFVDYLAGEMETQPRLTSDHVDAGRGNATRYRADRVDDGMERRLGEAGWQMLEKPNCSSAGAPRRYTRSRSNAR